MSRQGYEDQFDESGRPRNIDQVAAFRVKAVDPKSTLGDGNWKPAQEEFARAVAAVGTRSPKVTIDGKEYDLPPKENPILVPETVKGYTIGGTQFESYIYQTKVLARGIEETLFTVNDLHVYPGVVFKADPFLRKGEIEPLKVNDPDTFWSPVKLTVYGPSLKAAPSVGSGEKRVNLLKAPDGTTHPYVLTKPTSRFEYDQVRASLIPLVNMAGLWSETTETAHGIGHLSFQASLKVSGGWGSVATRLNNTEDEEKATVFMLLTQEAYRVAVDDAPLAAGWVRPEARSADLQIVRDLKGPLMYVSEVVYGRVVLVLANSLLTSSELKMALKADFSFWGTDVNAAAYHEKRNRTYNTSIRVLNWGGTGTPDQSYKFEEFHALLTKLKSAPLTLKSAMPIAFKARWLADHTAGEWIGITPLRTFTVKRHDITFDLLFDVYAIADDFDGFGRGSGELVIAAAARAAGSDAVGQDVMSSAYRGNNTRPNHHLYRGKAVPGEKFEIEIRQGEEDNDISAWDNIPNGDKDAYSHDFLKVDVQDLLRRPNRERKVAFADPRLAEWLKYEVVGQPFRGGNGVFLTLRVNPPPDLPLLKVPEAKNPTTEFDRKTADKR